MRGWSVRGALAGRVDGWRGSGRGAARTWKGAAQPEKRRNTTGATARGHGAARFTSHESRQHRAAASARARQVTVLPEVGACRSGAPQHETTRHQHIK